MNRITDKNISDWVGKATRETLEFRQAVHVILHAISNTPELNAVMVMKGGLLLAVKYESVRYTTDIDFSTNKNLDDISLEYVLNNLKKGLTESVEKLDYDLDCRVQSCKIQPSNVKNPTFPSMKIKIGYAYRGSIKHKSLIKNKCSTIVEIDYSLNEKLNNIEKIDLGLGNDLNAYSILDLIAEKIRSLLQQVKRNRLRRQDIYDLRYLIELANDFKIEEKELILKSLIEKSESREITANKDSLNDSEIRERAKKDYHTLEDEVEGELPDFDESYKIVLSFYENLPWI